MHGTAYVPMKRLLLLPLSLFFFFPAPASADGALPRDRSILTLLQINDVYTTLPNKKGTGGLARVATLKKQIATGGRTVELILAGDFLSPSVASSVYKGRQMIDTFSAAGVDIGILGNHEFDFGPDVLRQRLSEAKFTWLVSNVFDEATGRPLGGYPTQLLKEYGGVKVGYLGLCLDGDTISPDRRIGLRLEDPLATGEKLVASLKEQGAQIIVAITHLDYADDRLLAKRCPDIDVILGGHEHDASTTWVGRTLISKADSDAVTAARIDFFPGEAGERPEIQFELIPINGELADDPATALVARDYEDRLGMALEAEVGSTRVPLDGVSSTLRSRETNLGNFVADAMRDDTGAPIAIVNSGSIRVNQIMPAGPLRMKDLVAIHPFGGTVCVIEATGSLILEMLNNGFSELGEDDGRFPQVSGIRLLVDPAAPIGNRVGEVRFGEEPLDPSRTYQVAVSDFMIRQGDGYQMLANAKVLRIPEAGNVFPDVIEARIRALGGEIAPEVEGRIRFAGEAAPTLTQRPFLLDTDMGIDSVMGLLYLLREPTVDLRAITISHGTADVASGAANCLKILELTGDREIPVAAGENAPLQGERSFPVFWKDLANTLGETRLPEAKAQLDSLPAPDRMLAVLEESREPVTIVAMGPLTNLARAIAKKPEAVSKIAAVIAMGGAVKGPGNVDKPFVGIRNSVAEWNIYLDPQAADAVLRSGVKLRFIPVEATQGLPVTAEFRQKLAASPRDATSELLLSLLDASGEGIDSGWFYFWDTLAAVAATKPEVMGSHTMSISIVTEEGPSLGQTLPDPEGIDVRFFEEFNRETFEREFLETVLD